MSVRKATVEDFARLLGLPPEMLELDRMERVRETVFTRWLRRDSGFEAARPPRDGRDSFVESPATIMDRGFVTIRFSTEYTDYV
jgi:hypothetical protein